MTLASGRGAAEIEQDNRDHEPVFRRAAAVQVATLAEARRHAAQFPSVAEKFHAVPFFLPYIEPIDENTVLAKHREAALLRLLFVGREARRKGRDLFLEAVARLPICLRVHYELDVVSSPSGVAVDLLAGLNARVHRDMPRWEVLRLMRAAHIFAMPSRFESFGLTFIEAMAAGCAVIGPDWEVQSEILDHGRAGLTLPPTVEAIASALAELVEHPTRRLELAAAGHQRFRTAYAPEVVAKAYFDMFAVAVRALG
ncbi:glycosyltransferase family 4 protein [Prosthecomicrobium hirschii]|uniref:glycosyltransferase family 4 protein n=1 Tax=Prosthecodimorpha hirschii TaxID=665126 RepID=UPI00222043A9|nr:glycosyltransferase family 4 protein [Prosthecomicrobium hirschii]MCW1843784.1 glycosyltransferase family 4 protein [Prosthecomicrobium hirschii]